LSAKNLPGGQTQTLNVRRNKRINRHPFESDEVSPPEHTLDTDDGPNCNADLDDPNDSDENCAADFQCDMERDNSIKVSKCPEQRNVSAAPTVPGLISPTQMSKRQAEKVLVTVNAIETSRNTGVKK
jgi:hypothetical protein